MAGALLWLTTPSWLRSLVAGALVLAALAAGGMWIHHTIYKSGWDARDVTAKADEEKLNKAAAAQLATANKKTATLQLQLDSTIATHKQENLAKEDNYEKDLNAARAAVRAGNVKLRLAVSSCALSRSGQSQSTSPDPGASGGAQADVMPGTADDILRIAGAAAKDMRDYNALVVQYNEVRAACNAN